MRPAIHDATARQNSGGPLSVIGQAGDRSDEPRSSKIDDTEAEIAGLTDRSTHELRLAWRRLYRRRPPLGLSRDLIIRALANKMQECAYGGPSLAMTRRLNTLVGGFEKGRLSFDPGVVLKSGAKLVREWRGHTHTVLVIEDGFEWPALSLTDHDCCTDHRRPLVGPPVLRRDEANLPFAIRDRRSRP